MDLSKKVNKPEEEGTGAFEMCMRAFREASEKYQDQNEERKLKQD